MSRLILSNRPAVVERVLDGWRQADLVARARASSGGVTIATAKKRAIDNTNALILGEDRWITGVGTYVTYSGKVGGQALEELVDRFDPADPLAIRRLLFGHYTIAVRSGSRIVVFCDEIASHEVYYWIDAAESAFIVSNFLSDFVHHVDRRVGVSHLQAVRAAFHGERGIGRMSVLDQVFSLRGHEFLEIELRERGHHARLRRAPRVERTPLVDDFEATLDAYVSRSDRIFAALSAFSTIGINCTGGLDSRLLLAAARRHHLEPMLLYGVGNSDMTNTRNEDLLVAREIAEGFGWDLHLMDWSQDRMHDGAERRRLHQRYGFKQPYGSTSGMLEALEGGIEPYPELQMGGYNPAFTNRKPWSLRQQSVSIRDCATLFASEYREIFRDHEAEARYVDLLHDDFRELARDLDLEVQDDEVSHQDFVTLLIQARSSKEAFNLNTFNQFSYYLAPFFTSDLYRILLSVPAAWRDGDRFQLRAIAANCGQALDFPIFSGLKRFDLDRHSMTMTLAKSTKKPSPGARLKSRIEQRLPGDVRALLATISARVSRRNDVSRTFRNELRDVLAREHRSDEIDERALCEKDLRVVYRYLTMKELIK